MNFSIIKNICFYFIVFVVVVFLLYSRNIETNHVMLGLLFEQNPVYMCMAEQLGLLVVYFC